MFFPRLAVPLPSQTDRLELQDEGLDALERRSALSQVLLDIRPEIGHFRQPPVPKIFPYEVEAFDEQVLGPFRHQGRVDHQLWLARQRETPPSRQRLERRQDLGGIARLHLTPCRLERFRQGCLDLSWNVRPVDQGLLGP
jgi:hypothetical protein